MTKLIALLVEDERVFALPAWHRTISLMERRGLLVTHVAVIPAGPNQYGGMIQKLWYSRVFGVGNALRLALFSALEHKRRAAEPRTWDEMAHAHGLVVRKIDNPNGAEMRTFLQSSRCDVLHVLAPVTLSPEILDIPGSGVIAHQASMLPSCRGLFPYLWGQLRDEPLGQSFEIQARTPQGRTILAQRKAHPRVTLSMLSFQVWAAHRYPELAVDATQRLLAGKTMAGPTGVEPSYCGLPTRRDRLNFEARGGRLSRWSDLRLTLSIRNKLADITGVEADAEEGPAATNIHPFPQALPFRVNESRAPGKVLPMRPRRQAVSQV